MAAGSHFGWPKITFDRISHHFISIRSFSFFWIFFTKWPPAAILDDRKSLSIAFLAISDQYAAFFFFTFFTKWPPAAILDYPKITFDHISRHFRSIRSFSFFLHFLQITFERISRDFRSIRNFFYFFVQNGRRMLLRVRWPRKTIPTSRHVSALHVVISSLSIYSSICSSLGRYDKINSYPLFISSP